jgi:hypothetical protein
MPTSFRDWDSKFIPEPMSGCWLWDGCVIAGGYGQVAFENKPQSAHRVFWKLYRGEIPPGACILHTCDVRCCVNPDHLFLGTNKDNSEDMVLKNRQNKGEARPQAKLSDGKVRFILMSTASISFLAERFGVSWSTIVRVRQRTTWKHVHV